MNREQYRDQPPVIGFCAYSGTGKTTLLVRLLPLLKQAGLRVGVIKHSHHRFEIDQPGKDSYRLRKAGAAEMMIASGRRWALMVDLDDVNDGERDPDLSELLARMDLRNLDLVIVEGFKHASIPKIELYRPALGKPPVFPDDPEVIAVATDAADSIETGLPVFDLGRPRLIADFVQRFAARCKGAGGGEQ